MARKLKVNRSLILVTFLLLGIGLIIVASSGAVLKGSTRNVFFLKQGVVAIIGFILLISAMKTPYRTYLSRPALIFFSGVTLLLLVGVYLFPAYKGVHRWFVFPGFTIQPSELAKVTLLFFLAYSLPGVNWKERWGTILLFPFALVLLVIKEPDLGAAFILLAVTGVMLFVAGLPKRYVVLSAAVTLLILTTSIFSATYRHERLSAFLHRQTHADREAYQSIQATMAIGSGKFLGKGIGGSTQKLFYLPQPHTDFAFAILGEEMGFLGTFTVVFLYTLFLWQGVKIYRAHPHMEGKLLALGISFLIFFQAFIHISVNISLLPTKGLALPFISYGGTSLLLSCFMAGILLNISEEKS